MDINQFIQLVNGVGFPIATTIGLACFIVWDKKQRVQSREQYNEMQTALFHNLETSIENNTKAINQLLIKLGGENNG